MDYLDASIREEMKEMDTSQVVIAVIGSNALFTFIQFLIGRHDKKKEKQSDETKGMRDMIRKEIPLIQVHILIQLREYLHLV